MAPQRYLLPPLSPSLPPSLPPLFLPLPLFSHSCFGVLWVFIVFLQVCDFGLSRFDTSSNMGTMGKLRGTYHYVAPGTSSFVSSFYPLLSHSYPLFMLLPILILCLSSFILMLLHLELYTGKKFTFASDVYSVGKWMAPNDSAGGKRRGEEGRGRSYRERK